MVEPKSSCKSLCCGRGSAGPAGEESSDEEFDSCCSSQDRVQKFLIKLLKNYTISLKITNSRFDLLTRFE